VRAEDPALDLIRDNVDEEYARVREVVRQDGECPRELVEYRKFFESLRVEDGLVVCGTRLLVPKDARRRVLDLLHLSHSGVTKTTELATQLYVWPGMTNDVRVRVGTCSACVALLPANQPEPVLAELAEYPMEKVGADLFDLDTLSYLVMVDRFSGYPFVARLASTTTEAIWAVLLRWFCDYGFPRAIKTDGGPQFRGPFKEFCGQYNVIHVTSSPYNPRSNGLAEAAVKSVKSLLKKVGQDAHGAAFRLALLEWRNTPRADGFSPAYGFFGRHLRTQLPEIRAVVTAAPLEEFQDARRRVSERRVDLAGGLDLPPLAVGALVHYRHKPDAPWCVGGVGVEALPGGRSYWIETAAGGGFRRSRAHLRIAVPLEVEEVPRVVSAPTPVVAVAAGPRRSTRVKKLRKKVTFRL
jgi:hypothetical protein